MVKTKIVIVFCRKLRYKTVTTNLGTDVISYKAEHSHSSLQEIIRCRTTMAFFLQAYLKDEHSHSSLRKQ